MQGLGALTAACGGDTTIDQVKVIGGLAIALNLYLLNLGGNADLVSAMFYNGAMAGWEGAVKEFAAFLPKKE